ncbi:hypothetical protein SeMB42_g07837, partial [Synchytrium endobioticum]
MPADAAASDRIHRLTILQQPKSARTSACTAKADQGIIDPSPILQLHVQSLQTRQPILPYLQPSIYIVYATIATPHDFRKSPSPAVLLALQHKYASGLLSSGLMRLKDTNNVEGAFFVYANLAVKAQGTFMIKFSLFEIAGINLLPRAHVYSDPFVVYSPKLFPGLS